MSDTTPRLALPVLPPTPLQPQVTHNEALAQLDALSDLCLKGQFVNTPPSSPADGDSYLLGGAPTGAWSGHAYKIAYCLDGGWRFFVPFDGLRAFASATNGFLVYRGGAWLDASSLLNAGEAAIASAATCDLGAAGSLFVQVTGATAITSFGAGANLLRFVRFGGALTLTHNAVSLVLPGAASIITAAGDTATFASDGSGNWRCLDYSRAASAPASPTFGGMTVTGQSILVEPATGTDSGYVQVRNGGGNFYAGLDNSAGGSFGAGAYSPVIYSDANAPMVFVTNSTEFARGGTDGSLLVGATANGGWSGNARLAVVSANHVAISGYDTSGGNAFYARVDNVGADLMAFHYLTSNVGSITTNGSATTYGTTSDARLKTVAPEQGDYRAAIRALWVGDFTWKETAAPGFGVLAQQAWDVMPHHAGVTRPVKEDGAWHASSEPFAFLSLWGVKDLYALVEALAALEAANAF